MTAMREATHAYFGKLRAASLLEIGEGVEEVPEGGVVNDGVVDRASNENGVTKVGDLDSQDCVVVAGVAEYHLEVAVAVHGEPRSLSPRIYLRDPLHPSRSCHRVQCRAKKSNLSVWVMAVAMSFFWRARRLLSSVWCYERMVSSGMKKSHASHALVKRTGASTEIIWTSSSAFMIFFMRVNESW
ncbi:hypothetical protein ACFX10_019538 [Malus domestica]